jgi:hypothetical protein
MSTGARQSVQITSSTSESVRDSSLTFTFVVDSELELLSDTQSLFHPKYTHQVIILSSLTSVDLQLKRNPERAR